MTKATLSTAQRLMLAFGVVILLQCVSLVFSYRALGHSDAAMQTIYEDRTVPIGQLGQIRYLVARNRIILADALDSRAPEVLKRRLAEYDRNTAQADTLWKQYLATYLTPDEKRLAEQMQRDWSTYQRDAEQPTAQALRATQWEAAERGMAAISKLSPPVQKAVEALLELQVTVSAQTYHEASADNAATLRSLLILGLLSLVVSAVAAALIVRKMIALLGAEPHELAATAARIAAGDLTRALQAEARAGSVMATMDAMREQLLQIVSMVRQGAESVASASGQIAQGTQDLSARTETQASSLEETAASMSQMSASVQANAAGVRHAQQKTDHASSVALKGGDSVALMVETMKSIQASSQQINDIIGVIDSIAFQTNILALNAAVEAARAGEQGKGFAVVASEVRALAGRSAEAAREIRGLITRSVERVDQGTAVVQQVGATIHEVVDSIRDVATLMGQMTHTASEQDAGIRQVSEALGQIDQTTQQNAALVEEMAAASAHLKQQSDALVEAVSTFRLERSAVSAALEGGRTHLQPSLGAPA